MKIKFEFFFSHFLNIRTTSSFIFIFDSSKILSSIVLRLELIIGKKSIFANISLSISILGAISSRTIPTKKKNNRNGRLCIKNAARWVATKSKNLVSGAKSGKGKQARAGRSSAGTARRRSAAQRRRDSRKSYPRPLPRGTSGEFEHR